MSFWSEKKKKLIEHAQDTSYYKMKLNTKDWITIILMVVIYSVMAFINLGTFNTPKEFWTTSKVGEYFIVDLGEEVELSRINFYVGVKTSGKLSIYYYNNDREMYTVLYKYKSDDDTSTRKTAASEMDFGYAEFKIRSSDCEHVTTRYLKFTTTRRNLSIGEIGIFVNGSTEPLRNVTIIESTVAPENGDPAILFDDPDSIPYSYDVMNSTYFDEVYHGRTAYEHLHGIRPYEWTHPPVGKLLIAAGMVIFGENMFGMRAMGTIFGVLLIPLMYLFGKKITKDSFGGFAAAFLMMFDFMHFTHSRISSIDVYAVTFVILMFYFMYDYYVSRPQNLGLRKSMIFLLFSGLFMGLAISVKWNTAYGIIGLVILFVIALAGQFRDWIVLRVNKLSDEFSWTDSFAADYVVKIGIFCVLSFIVLPVTIYAASYIPFMTVTDGTPYTFADIINLQKTMFNYHSGLEATHDYQSAWYTWPVIGRPLYMYASADNAEGIRGSIVTMGNPAVWWGGILGVVASIAIAFQKKDRRIVPVIIAMLSLFLPWVLVTRCTFIYHYFPVLPFVILCSAYALTHLKNKFPKAKYFIYTYFAATVVLFIMFYPVLTGIKVDSSYIDNFTRWFPSWWW